VKEVYRLAYDPKVMVSSGTNILLPRSIPFVISEVRLSHPVPPKRRVIDKLLTKNTPLGVTAKENLVILLLHVWS
jgi:hypothetical protein